MRLPLRTRPEQVAQRPLGAPPPVPFTVAAAGLAVPCELNCLIVPPQRRQHAVDARIERGVQPPEPSLVQTFEEVDTAVGSVAAVVDVDARLSGRAREPIASA